MPFTIKPVGEHIGAECIGLDAARATAGDAEALKRALADHGVMFLRGQQLSPGALRDFGALFGPVETPIRDRFKVPGQDDVYVISNIVEDGKPIGNPNDGFGWHTDQSYMVHPTAYTFLYGVETPAEGAATQFATTVKAYDDLDEAGRARFAAMQAVHSLQRIQEDRTWDLPLSPDELARAPDVAHPMVRTHPLTRRKALYFGTKRACYPIGVPEGERHAFIDGLVDRCTKPGYVYSHPWQPGDLVMWDNRGLLHSATEYDRQKYRRRMHRVSVTGERPYL